MREESDTTFLFGDGEQVKLKEDTDTLSAGALGVICAFYQGNGYEVEFCDNTGLKFSTIMLESQLEKVI